MDLKFVTHIYFMMKVSFGIRSYSNRHNFWDSYYESCCHGNKNNVIISYLNFSEITEKKKQIAI